MPSILLQYIFILYIELAWIFISLTVILWAILDWYVIYPHYIIIYLIILVLLFSLIPIWWRKQMTIISVYYFLVIYLSHFHFTRIIELRLSQPSKHLYWQNFACINQTILTCQILFTVCWIQTSS